MTKVIIKYLLIASCILLVLFGVIKIIEKLDYKEPIIDNTTEIDSLKNIIRVNNIIITRNEHIIDSLYNHKSQTINKYETTIKNYSNPSIVSDDSISNYISKELQNWE